MCVCSPLQADDDGGVPVDLLASASLSEPSGPNPSGGTPFALHFPSPVPLTAWVPRRSPCRDILDALAVDLLRQRAALVTSASHVGAGPSAVLVTLVPVGREVLGTGPVDRATVAPLLRTGSADGKAVDRRVRAGEAQCVVPEVAAPVPPPAAASGRGAGAATGSSALADGGGKWACVSLSTHPCGCPVRGTHCQSRFQCCRT
jgi:hypothetical protein